MTQSIFLELSQSFKTDITEARCSFSVVSLTYCISANLRSFTHWAERAQGSDRKRLIPLYSLLYRGRQPFLNFSGSRVAIDWLARCDDHLYHLPGGIAVNCLHAWFQRKGNRQWPWRILRYLRAVDGCRFQINPNTDSIHMLLH